MVVQRVQTTSVFSNGQSFLLKYNFSCHFSGFCYLFCKVSRRTWVDTCSFIPVIAQPSVSSQDDVCVCQMLSWNTEHSTIFQRRLLLRIPRSSFLQSSWCHRTRWLKWWRFWLMCGRWPVRISVGTQTYWFKTLRGPTSHSAPNSTSYWQHS